MVPSTFFAFEKMWKGFSGQFPPISNPIILLDLNNARRVVERIRKQIPVDAPWKAKDAERLDSMTLSQFIDEICWTSFTKHTLTIVCRQLLCQETHTVSALCFLWYMASGQGLDRLSSITNGAQERNILGGSMRISEKMAEELGSKVKISSPVTLVELGDSKSVVHTSDGQTYESRFVISAMPLAVVNRVKFDPPLPDKKLQMIQRVPMGCVIKAMMFYDRAYWVEKGYSGQISTDHGPVLNTFDDTKPDGSHPCLMGFIVGEEAIKLSGLTVEERKMVLANHYAEQFKCPELRNPINYVENNWMAEEYSGGGYVATFPTGTLTTFGPYMREPFRRLHFAGTELASVWAGYMDGAVQSGERAAREILHALGKIPEDQIWQDEPPLKDFEEVNLDLGFKEKILPSVPTFLSLLATSGVAAAGAAYYKAKL